MHQPPNQKNTPNRRRPPQGKNRRTPQKTYASENDVPTSRPDRSASPATPQKSASGGPTFLRATSTNQKQRKGNKNRNKNGLVDSPSFLTKDVVPVPIFAGSTFHASPAPSALPIPSFLGVASATSPKTKPNPSPAQDLSPPTTDSDEASQSGEDPMLRNDESPLEFFFRADRAEKAKTRRASSANAGAVPEAPYSPPRESPQGCNTFPRATLSNPARRPIFPQRNTTSPGISTNELDGTPGKPLGPAFSTPYQQRIKAARSNHGSAQGTPSAARDPTLNSSEALKRYLFTGQLGSAAQQPVQQNPQYQAQQPSPQQSPVHQSFQQRIQHEARQQQLPRQQLFQKHSSKPQFPPGMFPASILTGHAPSVQASAPSPHMNPSSNHRSEQILALEGDLRRMLKLDSSG